MSKKFDIITIGGATLDIFMKDGEFEVGKFIDDEEQLCVDFGEKIIIDETHFTYGGGGMNTAVSFAKIGLKTAYIGSIGGDEVGDALIKKLEEENINAEFLHIDKKHKTGISVALHAGSRDRTLLLFRGANNHLHQNCIATDMHTQTKWIYLSHLSGKSDLCLDRIAKTVEESNIKLAWNPGSTQLSKGQKHLERLLQNTTILNLNKEEAEKLTGKFIKRNQDLDESEIDNLKPLFDELLSYGPKIVVITDGKHGAAVSDGIDIVTSKNHEINTVRDTTGAGDAFGSGFVAGYIYTKNIKKSLKWGIVQSGSVVTKFGAQNGLLSKKEIQHELEGLGSNV